MRPHTTHIIGIDPGKTSGIAHYRSDVIGSRRVEVCQIEAIDTLGTVTSLVHGITDPIIIATERFTIHGSSRGTGRKTQQPDALKTFGALEVMCYANPQLIFAPQSASEAKHYGNMMLRSLGWYNSGMRHANDATRHVILALVRFHPQEMIRLLESTSKHM